MNISDEQSDILKRVQAAYGNIAKSSSGNEGCGCGCGSAADEMSARIGYSPEEIAAAPTQSNLGLGCGNPTAVAGLEAGETVLDLGSGAGFDCFLAAAKVGLTGNVIGVDATPEMIAKARENAARDGIGNVEFRLGQIEDLPVVSGSVDAAISNCVINLSADKPRVFRELFRVLRPGGRIAVSDIVLLKELPDLVKTSAAAYVACVGGAMLESEYENAVRQAGFANIEVEVKPTSICFDTTSLDPIGRELLDSLEGADPGDFVASAYVTAIKPAQ